MSKWRYIFLSVTVFSLAIVAASFAPAISQQSNNDSFMIATDGGQFAWRVNVSDGSVSYCLRDSNSAAENYVKNQKPFCSGSSAPAR